MKLAQSRVVFETSLGVPLAFVVWGITYALSYAVISLLDSLRGLDGDWFQLLFREWFTPGVGGYAAIQVVNRWLKVASIKWVGICFCLPLLALFVGFPLYLLVFHRYEYQFSWGQQIMQWGMAISSSVGAYIASQSIVGDS